MTDAFGNLVDFAWGPEPIAWVQEMFGPEALRFFAAVTVLGEAEAVAVAVALLFWGFGRAPAYGLLTLVVAVALLNSQLKDLFNVPRPNDPSVIAFHQVTHASFPSGHSAIAGALWGGLMAFGRAPPLVVLAAVLLVMLSRMYLGVHFLGDVVVGALLGLALAVAFARLWPHVYASFARRPTRVLAVLAATTTAAALATVPVSRFGWALFGITLGAAIGELVEFRWVRFRPGRVPLRQQVGRWAIGLGGAAVIFGGERLLGSGGPLAEGLVLCLATLWLTLGAPFAFVKLGFVPSRHPVNARG